MSADQFPARREDDIAVYDDDTGFEAVTPTDEDRTVHTTDDGYDREAAW